MIEETFVMLKPDAIERCLVGEIISVFEKAGLRIMALKMLTPTRETVSKHYGDNAEWVSTVGEKTLRGYAELGIDVKKEFGTEDPIDIGLLVRQWLIEFICSGTVVVMVLAGNAAVSNVRRLCGNTLPLLADPGSIRGRYGLDSPDLACAEKRPVYNLVHASGNLKEAQFEIGLWFPDSPN